MFRLVPTTVLLLAATGCYPFVWDFTDRGDLSSDDGPVGIDDPLGEDTGSNTIDPPDGEDVDGDGWTVDDGDCDDNDPERNPGEVETCDGVDNDCDGNVDNDTEGANTWYRDRDGDGYGVDVTPITACTPPDGYAAQAGDCDDYKPTIYPGADEHCDGADEDCDSEPDNDAVDAVTYYYDIDGDGYGTSLFGSTETTCDAPSPGYVPESGDCADGDETRHPGAIEFCDDIDSDCDGQEAPYCKRVAAGATFSCVNPPGGGAMCGGQNDTNQLNINGFDYDFNQIAPGRSSGCALLGEQIVCWGSDTDRIEVDAPSSASLGQICLGTDFGCALERPDGQVTCWGNGAVAPPTGVANQIACQGYFACTLSDGFATCSDPSDYLLGDEAPNWDYTMIDAGWNFACGLRPDGSIDCWGDDGDGQISGTPSGTGYTTVTTGYYHACALDSAGAPICWGRNANGQTAVVLGIYAEIDAGQSHTCAIGDRSDPAGTVTCWGASGYYDGLLPP